MGRLPETDDRCQPYLSVGVHSYSAAERMTITVRRIAKIKYVRKVVWRDEH